MEIGSADNLPNVSRRVSVLFLLADDPVTFVMNCDADAPLLAVRAIKREAHARTALMQDKPARVQVDQIHGVTC